MTAAVMAWALSQLAGGQRVVLASVVETSGTTVNSSIERTAGGAWASSPNANTKGTVNSL